ncbi:MAG: hypothetical protein PVJ49_10005 [Acidobacteriota bacterium]|jgi:hypothetical protein
MPATETVDISRFERRRVLLEPITVWLVIKSQDQLERRARMVNKLRSGEKIGRLAPRPVAEGLLLKYSLPPAGTTVPAGDAVLDVVGALAVTRLREPRHIYRCSDDRFLLTEIGRVDLIDGGGKILDTFTHPYFAFLHTVVLDGDRRHMLVTASGYDAILEIDVETKQESWSWFGWDHGFNPNDEGVWYTNTPTKAEELERQGHAARYIDPQHYNEQGLLTGTRTTHPNVALYNPYSDESTIVASLGYGQVVEIDRAGGDHRVVVDAGVPVLHGLAPHGEGWMVTNTCRGELWLMDRHFNLTQSFDFTGLPGKPSGLGDIEWLQHVTPLADGLFACLDANRGIIVVDVNARRYEILRPDPDWCIQDLLVIERAT